MLKANTRLLNLDGEIKQKIWSEQNRKSQTWTKLNCKTSAGQNGKRRKTETNVALKSPNSRHHAYASYVVNAEAELTNSAMWNVPGLDYQRGKLRETFNDELTSGESREQCRTSGDEILNQSTFSRKFIRKIKLPPQIWPDFTRNYRQLNMSVFLAGNWDYPKIVVGLSILFCAWKLKIYSINTS